MKRRKERALATRKPVTPAMVRQWEKMIDMGYTRADIARKYGFTRQYVASLVTPSTRSIGREERTISVGATEWGEAQRIAATLGLRVPTGIYAGQGSVSLLIENIGRGTLKVTEVEEDAENGPRDANA